MQLTVGSLFAGIGGFDLGFARAGFEIRWQVEIDPFCRVVLAQHWPDVRRYDDIRDVHGAHVADTARQRCFTGEVRPIGVPCDGQRTRSSDPAEWTRLLGTAVLNGANGGTGAACLESVDVICGGFPCQPHSLAGRRGGSIDERDLWPEFARIIRECRPRWVVVENVPGLLSSEAGRFFGTILGDLAACGYDAEWDCLPAAAFGAPHRRDRVWLVAYPMRARGQQIARSAYGNEGTDAGRAALYDHVVTSGGEDVADADEHHGFGWRRDVQMGRIWGTGEAPHYDDVAGTQWRVEPDVGRVASRVPARVDRLRGLGNAIVPQIAEWIGRRILAATVTPAAIMRPPVGEPTDGEETR